MICLRLLGHWDRGFESHSRHGCLCVRLFCACVVPCVGSGLATGWFLVQGVLPSVKNDYETEKEARTLNGLEEPLKKKALRRNITHIKTLNLFMQFSYQCEDWNRIQQLYRSTFTSRWQPWQPCMLSELRSNLRNIFWIFLSKPSRGCLLHASFLLGLLFERGNVFLRNVDWLRSDHTESYPRKYNSSSILVCTG
jgi:hypothetical protein